MSKRQAFLAMLESQGFDLSYLHSSVEGVVIGCSQCQAATINGQAAHKTGCSNAMHKCHGCNALVPVRVQFCQDCR